MIHITEYNESYKTKLLAALENETNNLPKLYLGIDNIAPYEEYLVCLDENENIVGYCRSTFISPSVRNLDYIYVLPAFRRDKNGSVIMVALFTRSVNRLIARLTANCPIENADGTAFLKAMGFTCNHTESGVNFYDKSLLYMYKG